MKAYGVWSSGDVSIRQCLPCGRCLIHAVVYYLLKGCMTLYDINAEGEYSEVSYTRKFAILTT